MLFWVCSECDEASRPSEGVCDENRGFKGVH